MYLKSKPSNTQNLVTTVRLASKALDEDMSYEFGVPIPAEVIGFSFPGWQSYKEVEESLTAYLEDWDVMSVDHIDDDDDEF